MNVAYLGNHAEQLTDLDQVNSEGELYVVGRSKDAFLAFRLPSEERVKRKYVTVQEPDEEGNLEEKKVCDEITIGDVQIYEAILYPDGSEIQEGYVKDHRGLFIDRAIDLNHMGVFRPTEGSRLRKTLEEKLPEPVKKE